MGAISTEPNFVYLWLCEKKCTIKTFCLKYGVILNVKLLLFVTYLCALVAGISHLVHRAYFGFQHFGEFFYKSEAGITPFNG